MVAETKKYNKAFLETDQEAKLKDMSRALKDVFKYKKHVIFIAGFDGEFDKETQKGIELFSVKGLKPSQLRLLLENAIVRSSSELLDTN